MVWRRPGFIWGDFQGWIKSANDWGRWSMKEAAKGGMSPCAENSTGKYGLGIKGIFLEILGNRS